MPVLAENAKLYRNTGTYGTPTWTEIDNVQNVTLSLEKDTIDVTTRGSGGHREYLDGLIDAAVEFEFLWDSADADFSALQAAFFNKTAIEFLVLEGSEATSGNEGLRATMLVAGFSRNEQLGEALTIDVTLKPVKNSDAPPAWYTVP